MRPADQWLAAETNPLTRELEPLAPFMLFQEIENSQAYRRTMSSRNPEGAEGRATTQTSKDKMHSENPRHTTTPWGTLGHLA